MSGAKHLGILEIDATILLRMLGFPEDAKVDGLRVDFERNAAIVKLRIEHPDLPLVDVGEVVTTVVAEFTNGAGPTFKGWV